jgi:hypothetical protein
MRRVHLAKAVRDGFHGLRPPHLPPVFVLTLACAVGAGLVGVHAGASEWASQWRDHEITIDGADADWQGFTMPVKGQHFSLGVANDGDAIYLCLPTKDRATKAQIARSGLIVWFERTSGKKRPFGVHFPVGLRPEVMDYTRGRGVKPGQEKEPERDDRKPPEVTQVGGQDEIEILGPKKDDVWPLPIDRSGIAARIGVHEDLLVFELKVPLRKSQDLLYAIDAEPGEALRVDVRTPEWRGPLPMGRSPIGINIGVGTRGGGAAASWPAVWDTSMLKPVEFRMTLRLARPR